MMIHCPNCLQSIKIDETSRFSDEELVNFRNNHKRFKPNKAKVVVKDYWKKKSWEVEN
jgi:hypothetical protein